MSKKVSSGYLSVRAEDILAELNSDEEYCVGYSYLGGKTPENVAAIKELKEHEMIEFWRGLMTDDGEVAGSGWCRSRKGNEYVEEYKL
jgi:hypothetical protein